MGKASPAERAAVVKYALRGCTKAHTIRQLKLSKAVVDRWWTGADGSAPCLEDSPRPGRPRLLDSTEAKAIKRALKGGATLTVVKKRRDKQGSSGLYTYDTACSSPWQGAPRIPDGDSCTGAERR